MSEFGNEFVDLIKRRQTALAAVSDLHDGDGLFVVSAMMAAISDIMWQVTVEQFKPGTDYALMRSTYTVMWTKHAKQAADRAAKRPAGTVMS
jgi:hypothetical protein